MKKRVIFGALGALLLLVSGCVARQPGVELSLVRQSMKDGRYDNNSFLVDSSRMRLEEVTEAVYGLKTVTTFRTPKGVLETKRLSGVGVSLEGGYILTVDHVVTQYALSVETPFGKVVLPAEKLTEQTYVMYEGQEYLLERFYTNAREDLALLRVPTSLRLATFPYPIGNSDELRLGNYVYLVGNPLNFGINVREGIVSSLEVPEIVASVDVVTENAFMVSNGLNPGDSGTPVLAIRDGVYELVGLSQGTFAISQRMGWVIRINVARRIPSFPSFPSAKGGKE